MLKSIHPRDAAERIRAGDAVLVDIREPAEHAREHIPGARLLSLSRLDRERLAEKIRDGATVIYHCQSGNRTNANAAQLATCAVGDALVLEGGLAEWKRSGLPTQLDRTKPIELQRQVQLAAGALVLLGITLAILVSPWWAGLSAFVGAGLTFAGATGWCGMAKLLQVMPWNRAG
jgi:rhodanese-related sulfurtransferase